MVTLKSFTTESSRFSKCISFALLLGLGLVTATANATTIDFSAVPAGTGNNPLGVPIVVDGFEIEETVFGGDGPYTDNQPVSVVATADGNVLQWAGLLEISRVGGGVFDLTQVMINYEPYLVPYGDFLPSYTDLTISGYNDSGSQVASFTGPEPVDEYFTCGDGLCFGTGAYPDPGPALPFDFSGSEWSNLSYITISSQGCYGIYSGCGIPEMGADFTDLVSFSVATEVPLPAAIWFFISALGLLTRYAKRPSALV